HLARGPVDRADIAAAAAVLRVDGEAGLAAVGGVAVAVAAPGGAAEHVAAAGAAAVGVLRARPGVVAFHAGAAAVHVGLVAVLHPVGARGRERADAVRAPHAQAVAVGEAGPTAAARHAVSAAAVDVRLRPVLHVVHA